MRTALLSMQIIPELLLPKDDYNSTYSHQKPGKSFLAIIYMISIHHLSYGILAAKPNLIQDHRALLPDSKFKAKRPD